MPSAPSPSPISTPSVTVSPPSASSIISPLSSALPLRSKDSPKESTTITTTETPSAPANRIISEPYGLLARHIGIMEPDPIGAPLMELEAILSHESTLLFRAFTADTAFALGTHLRNRLHALTPKPAVINITLANSNQLLFHACTHPGVTPDNDFWVARKRKTVLRFGCSSWAMGRKFGGDEKAFAEKYGLGAMAGEYAIHGGAVPVRVEGVEGIVAVVVVSGLSQQEDHQVVVEGLEDCKLQMAQSGNFFGI